MFINSADMWHLPSFSHCSIILVQGSAPTFQDICVSVPRKLNVQEHLPFPKFKFFAWKTFVVETSENTTPGKKVSFLKKARLLLLLGETKNIMCQIICEKSQILPGTEEQTTPTTLIPVEHL